MELIRSSSIMSERHRKLCTFGIGFLMFALFINQNRYPILENISAFRSSVIFSSSSQSTSCSDQDDQFNNTSSSSSSSSTSTKMNNEATSNFFTTSANDLAAVPAVNSSSISSMGISSDQYSATPAVAGVNVEILDQELPAAAAEENKSTAAAASKTKLEASTPTEMEKPTMSEDSKYTASGNEYSCDIFDGRWVYNKAGGAPSYNKSSCPFTEEHWSCRENGRPDFDYLNWSWQPRDCNDIPVFNGTDMLEKLRGKRIIMVGDSLNKNQWMSLACLLYTSIPSTGFDVDAKGSMYKILRAKDYDFVLEFYWSPHIVELEVKKKGGSKVLVLDKLPASSNKWKGADVMIFNSAHWWMHHRNIRSWDLFEYKNKLFKDMKIELAYEKGLTTWANWIKQNVNPNKTTVFFRSLSPEHHGMTPCHNSTRPIMDHSLYVQKFPRSMIDVIVKKIKDMRTGSSPITIKYLNITKMSEYRRDAHPSVYEEYGGGTHSDCSHWCLPGLPDTWNRLLYVSLFFDKAKYFSTR